jgi:hypothetical protein
MEETDRRNREPEPGEKHLEDQQPEQRGGANDTRDTVSRLAQLRAQKAKLLGFPNYAAWKLEDQMATFTGAHGERSPDRLDSLVWALTPFLRRVFGPPGHAVPRKWAASAELAMAGEPPYSQARRRLASAHGGAYASRKWTLEDFAPAEDPGQSDGGPRANVMGWR